MNKEQRIDEILQSAKKIRQVTGNPFLHTRIEVRLHEEKTTVSIAPRWIYAVSAAFLLLLFVNITVWRNLSKPPQPIQEQAVADEFSLTGSNRYALNY